MTTTHQTVRRALREPLLHFFIAGLALYGFSQLRPGAADPHRIVVSAATVSRIAQQYQSQYGQAPTPAQLRPLIDRYVDEEVLYRQGVKLGLGQGDEIVRRRIVQKMQFLTQDTAAPAEPTQAELAGFYAAHRGDYMTPERISFSHIYFSPDRGGEQAALARATAVRAQLSDAVHRAPERGDAFPDLYDYSDFGPDETRRLFGDSPFSKAVFGLPTGHWSAPLRSGYGWHLVYIGGRVPPQSPPLAEVQDKVRADDLAARQAIANAQQMQKLKREYRIVRNDKDRGP